MSCLIAHAHDSILSTDAQIEFLVGTGIGLDLASEVGRAVGRSRDVSRYHTPDSYSANIAIVFGANLFIPIARSTRETHASRPRHGERTGVVDRELHFEQLTIW